MDWNTKVKAANVAVSLYARLSCSLLQQMQFEIYYLAGKIIIFDGKKVRSISQALYLCLQELDMKRFIK
jgi:hypothetical protein